MSEFTHINEKGEANMVDVTAKAVTERFAKARGVIRVSGDVLKALEDKEIAKGDVLGAARIAGIMAAKKTPELIPLCHTLLLTKVSVDFEVRAAEQEILSMICARPWIRPWSYQRSVWKKKTGGKRDISKDNNLEMEIIK